MAMASLATLATIGALAFFTPLLPISPPDKHHTELQYEPPKFSPLFNQSFVLDWKPIEETSQRLAAISQNLPTASGRDRDRIKREMEDALLRPYREAGYPDVGPISRWMIRVRYRVFGELNLASVAGRDEFGRDLLARVFGAPAFRSSSASSPRSSRF